MKAVIAINQFGQIGGSFTVNMYTAKILSELGFDIIYVTVTGAANPNKVKELLNIQIPFSKTYTLFSRNIPFLGIYQRHLLWISLLRAIKHEEPHLVWLDTDLYKLVVKNRKFKLIEYIHFPYQIWLETRDYFSKYSNKFWKTYFLGYIALRKITGRDNPFKWADEVFTNSSWTAGMIEKLYGSAPKVLYPPVKVDTFLSKEEIKRDNSAIMIGRISPEKRYEEVIKAISLTNMKPKLRIVGGLIPTNKAYMLAIKNLAEKLNVKLEININAKHEQIKELLLKSKILIHSTREEHFGIAVVEGMAAGCVPIVHKSGGPYYDIIDKGKYGLYYDNIKELAQKIDFILQNEYAWKKMSELARSRSKMFDEENFKKIITLTLYKLGLI
ncbi:MAG: glycosyltransferase [Thermoprotei archaeon]